MKHVQMPKNRVSNMDYQDMPMTSREDTETGGGNPQGETIHLSDIYNQSVGKMYMILSLSNK